MPYYDYVCSECKSKFEIKRCISEIDDPAVCPECASEHVSRQVSKVAAFSHGSGGDVSALGGGGGCGGGCGSCGGGSCGSCGSSRN